MCTINRIETHYKALCRALSDCPHKLIDRKDFDTICRTSANGTIVASTNVTTIVMTKNDYLVAVDGPAFYLEDCFIQLIRQRPEMRGILDSALRRSYQLLNW